MVTRRHLLKTSGSLAGLAMFGLPCIAIAADPRDLNGTIVGHGEFRYRFNASWSKADRKSHPVNDCHEMVQAADGRLFLITNHRKNNILIYEPDGKVVGNWTLDWDRGAHGLSIVTEDDGQQNLLLCDIGGKVVKTDLDGKVLLELPHAQKCGAYATEAYRPTEACQAPNGDIYVADGYGSQFILQFKSDGTFVRKFGGKSTQASNKHKFMQAHGVAIDHRGDEPLVLCTARIRNEFKWFTLDGKYVKQVYLPGAYMSRPVIDGEHLYSGICFGSYKYDYRMHRERGFITILDKNNKVISNPGGHAPVYEEGKLTPMLQDQPIFRNVHDVCVDSDGNLYGCQWNAGKVYPYKLEKL